MTEPPLQHLAAILPAALSCGLAVTFVSGCGNGDALEPVEPAGPGVIFTYPYPDQFDVPAGTPIAVAFSHPIERSVLESGCSIDSQGTVIGAFCAVGPDDQLVPAEPTVDPSGRLVELRSPFIASGGTYRLYVRPALFGDLASDLPDEAPLLQFHSRESRIRAGARATVLAINGQRPEAFSCPGSAGLPQVDFATVHLLFSEPIDPRTVIAGQSFGFYRITETGQEMPVSGSLFVQGIHLSFDPVADLYPGATYRIRLSGSIRDLGGESLAGDIEFVFAPQSSRTGGVLLEQILEASPAEGDDEFPAPSLLSQRPINTIGLDTPVIGKNQIAIKSGTISSHLGNPAQFAGPIPLAIRRGQTLHATGLDVAFGGTVPADLRTGDITVTFVSDATGYLIRSPYRAPGQIPNDGDAPVFLVVTFDIALTAEDAAGNAVLNQTILNVQASGVAVAGDGTLAIEAVGTMELDLMGVARVPATMALRLATSVPGSGRLLPDETPPQLVAFRPARGSRSFPVDDSILVTFSEAIDIADPALGQTISLVADADRAVDFALASYGSTLIVRPRADLTYDTGLALFLGSGIRDFAGNPLVLRPLDPSGGTGLLLFATPRASPDAPAPPVLTALYPGLPCALENGSADSLGHCRGAAAGDEVYPAAMLPARRAIEAAFNQAIDPDSVILGAQCGEGSIRIEQVDASGTCQGTVSGTLAVRERRLRFLPSEPWTQGVRYALTLVGGIDSTWQPGEIRGSNGKPLNTDPLCGTIDGNSDTNNCEIGDTGDDGGGPDIVIPFVGAPASADTYVSVSTDPQSDVNGNGILDPGEIAHGENSARAVITAIDGIIKEAWFSPDSCTGSRDDKDDIIYLSATLPVSLGPAQTDCEIARDAKDQPIVAEHCVPALMFPQLLFGTSLRLCADAEVDGDTILAGIRTRQMVMRMRQTSPRLEGYIVPGPDGAAAEFTTALTLLMDAPDMRILGMDHDLYSKELSVTVRGPVTFTDDGRIRIDAASTSDVLFRVNVTETGPPNNTGFIALTIPAGQLRVQLLGQPSKDAHLRP